MKSESLLAEAVINNVCQIEKGAKDLFDAIAVTKDSIQKSLRLMAGFDPNKLLERFDSLEKRLESIEKRLICLEEKNFVENEYNLEDKHAVKDQAPPKKVKPKHIDRSIVLFEITFAGIEVDPDDLEEAVRSIKMDGLEWGESSVDEFAFGIKKMQIACRIEDEKVSADDLQEDIEALDEFVAAVEIKSFTNCP